MSEEVSLSCGYPPWRLGLLTLLMPPSELPKRGVFLQSNTISLLGFRNTPHGALLSASALLQAASKQAASSEQCEFPSPFMAVERDDTTETHHVRSMEESQSVSRLFSEAET